LIDVSKARPSGKHQIAKRHSSTIQHIINSLCAPGIDIPRFKEANNFLTRSLIMFLSNEKVCSITHINSIDLSCPSLTRFINCQAPTEYRG
jgi:hypothetical protein